MGTTESASQHFIIDVESSGTARWREGHAAFCALQVVPGIGELGDAGSCRPNSFDDSTCATDPWGTGDLRTRRAMTVHVQNHAKQVQIEVQDPPLGLATVLPQRVLGVRRNLRHPDRDLEEHYTIKTSNSSRRSRTHDGARGESADYPQIALPDSLLPSIQLQSVLCDRRVERVPRCSYVPL